MTRYLNELEQFDELLIVFTLATLLYQCMQLLHLSSMLSRKVILYSYDFTLFLYFYVQHLYVNYHSWFCVRC